jgi:hypothetical protein
VERLVSQRQVFDFNVTKRRFFTALVVGCMASATAMPYIFLVVPGKSDLIGLCLAGIVAFFGAGFASFAIVGDRRFSFQDAVKLFLLSDLFAVIAFILLIFVIGPAQEWLLPNAAHLHPAPPTTSRWLRFPATAWFFFIFAITLGNWMTRGVGIIMALPPVLWLLARRRPTPSHSS